MRVEAMQKIIGLALVSLCVTVCFLLYPKQKNSHAVLKIGSNLWPGYEPYYLAEYNGYYKNSGIRPIRLSSATQVMSAYKDGQIDAACLTINEALKLREYTGDDFSIVLINDVSSGADALVAEPNIKSLHEIKGKLIGVERSALGAYILHRILQISGLSINDVKLQQLEINEHENAFKNKSIDAVITFDPVKSRLLGLGGKVLFDSTSIPGEIIDVTIVRNSFLEKNPHMVSQRNRQSGTKISF